ncbi:MAG: hypothetical protein Sapg2KO_00920 [Saprospiraceae bacterium]
MKQNSNIKEKLKNLKKPLLVKMAKEVDLDNYKKLTSKELVAQLTPIITNDTWDKFISIRRRKNIKVFTIITFISIIGTLLGIYADAPVFIKDVFLSKDYSLSKRAKELNLTTYDVKILILPFETYSENGDDIGKVLGKRLNNLGLEDSLRLLAYYYEDFNFGNINSNNEAEELLAKTRFDIVIFGDQLTNNCNSGLNEVCIKYLVNPNIKDHLNQNKEYLAQKFYPYSLKGLFEGDLQGKIDLVINKILLLIYKNNGESSKSLKQAEIIVDSLGGVDKESFFDLIIQRLYHQEYKLALEEIDGYNSSFLDNSIEDLLYSRSLKVMVYSRYDVGKLAKLLEENDVIFSLFESEIPKTELVARAFHRIGEFTADHFPKYSIPFLENAIDLYNDFDLQDERNRCIHDLGIAKYYNGQYEAATNYLNQALSKYGKNKKFEQWLIINAEFYLGMSYAYMSNNRKANKHFNKVYEATKKANIPSELFKYLILITDAYIDKEESKQVEKWLNKLEKVQFKDKHENDYLKYVVVERNSRIALLKGNNIEAIEYFSKSQEIWQSLTAINDQECEANENLLLAWKKLAEQNIPIWTFRINVFLENHRKKCR